MSNIKFWNITDRDMLVTNGNWRNSLIFLVGKMQFGEGIVIATPTTFLSSLYPLS